MSDQLFIQNYIYLDKNTYLTEMNSNTVSSYQSEHVSKNKFLDDYKVFYNNISPNEKNTMVMDKYNEYSPADFLNFGEDKVDIFIQNNQIFVMSAPKEIHEYTIGIIRLAIEKALEQVRTNNYSIDDFGSTDVELFNYNNCCHIFIKQPDFSFNICPKGERKYPSIIG